MFGRCMQRSGIAGTFKTLIEEVTTTMTATKAMAQKLKGNISKKHQDNVTAQAHLNWKIPLITGLVLEQGEEL